MELPYFSFTCGVTEACQRYLGTEISVDKMPTKSKKHDRSFDKDILALSLTMTSQSVVKHFLTEGDKFILSWFSPLQDQGGYAVAVNYGMSSTSTSERSLTSP